LIDATLRSIFKESNEAVVLQALPYLKAFVYGNVINSRYVLLTYERTNCRSLLWLADTLAH
jgi:hypothetical protein